MTTTPTEKSRDDRGRQEDGLLEAVLADSVLAALGRPSGPYRVQVRCVWGSRYRVNVFVTGDDGTVRVPHSFFVEADTDGKILSSSPPLVRAY